MIGAAFVLRGQTIEAVPKRVMVDEVFAIHAGGLQPGERVSIRAELVDGDGERWTSKADFVADGQGGIDTAKQAPVAGSYKSVSATGLVWAMMPSSRKVARYRPPRDFAEQKIDFQLMRGGTLLANASLVQAEIAEGTARIDLHDGELRGTLFVPAGNERHTGILVLGGSEGGLPARRAAWLASHGFAALALAYFRYQDLPQELAGIPLEYFGRAVTWMTQRAEIASGRIAVMGVSRGAELALQMGSMYPAVKAVVAYSPANVRYPACCGLTVVPYAWTWHGNPLAYHAVRGMSRDESMEMRAAIEVERTGGPIMLISGEADRVWDSRSMADAVVTRLERAHFTHRVAHLNYLHAGHGAGRPEIVPAWQGPTRNPMSGREMEMGGTPEGNIQSSLDAIGKVVDFLQQSFAAH